MRPAPLGTPSPSRPASQASAEKGCSWKLSGSTFGSGVLPRVAQQHQVHRCCPSQQQRRGWAHALVDAACLPTTLAEPHHSALRGRASQPSHFGQSSLLTTRHPTPPHPTPHTHTHSQASSAWPSHTTLRPPCRRVPLTTPRTAPPAPPSEAPAWAPPLPPIVVPLAPGTLLALPAARPSWRA
jgi:hypothetical protein